MSSDLITPDEERAFRLSGELAQACRAVIGDGPQSESDWAELALYLHGIQNMLCRQVAGRALPGEIRLLGETLRPAAARRASADPTPTAGGMLNEVRLGRNFLRVGVGDRVKVAPSKPGKRDGFESNVLAIRDTGPVSVDVTDPYNGARRTVPVGRVTRRRKAAETQ